MKIQTPNNIEVLLHCHTSPTPHPRCTAPAVADALSMLLREGCIKYNETTRVYHTTPKGRAWVQALCNVEIPREVYVDAQGNILS